MSVLIRRIYMVLIGLAAGAFVWPIIELILRNQESLSSYFKLSIIAGSIFGLFMGGFFGTINGIVLRNNYKIITGILSGMVTGMLAGLLGFLASQAILFITGQYLLQNMRSFNNVGLPVSRALGWAVMGIFIGAGEGIRAKSLTKIKIGMLGGLAGGLAGGFALEYLIYFSPDIVMGRFFGFILFGVMLGLFYGFIESKMSFGKLHLLNGKYKGKEFIINQGTLSMGNKKNNDIVLNDYNKIQDIHVQLHVKGDELFIEPDSDNSIVLVNDKKIQKHKLIRDDVVQIGNAKLLYRF